MLTTYASQSRRKPLIFSTSFIESGLGAVAIEDLQYLRVLFREYGRVDGVDDVDYVDKVDHATRFVHCVHRVHIVHARMHEPNFTFIPKECNLTRKMVFCWAFSCNLEECRSS